MFAAKFLKGFEDDSLVIGPHGFSERWDNYCAVAGLVFGFLGCLKNSLIMLNKTIGLYAMNDSMLFDEFCLEFRFY